MPKIKQKQILVDIDIDMNSNKVTELTPGTAGTDGVNKNQLDAVEDQISALEWQDSALDFVTDNTVVPATEVSGDRYILSSTGGAPNAAWDGASAGDIVEFDGTNWIATTPTVGMHVDADDEPNVVYRWSGSAWVAKTWEVGGSTPQRTVNAASVTSSDEDDAVSDIFGTFDPKGDDVPSIHVNGILVEVGDGVKTKDCYFAESGVPGTAIAFSALSGDEDLQWNGTIAGYELAVTDEVICEFTVTT